MPITKAIDRELDPTEHLKFLQDLTIVTGDLNAPVSLAHSTSENSPPRVNSIHKDPSAPNTQE